MAVFTSSSWAAVRESRPDVGNPGLRKLATMAVAAVLIQLVLGAGFRHGAFGIIPHISGAIVITALIIATSVITIRRHGGDKFLARPAKVATALVLVQVGLGVAAYFARLAAAGDPQPLEPMISLTVAHLVVGALTLASVLVLCLRSHRALSVQGLKTTDVTAVEFRSPRRAAV